uniref:Uncharacterized protein n=1 Tax=Athene cunicularia TaxID=194338 RepID=A0A663N1Y2_ATHCN
MLSTFFFLLNGYQKETVEDILYKFWYDTLSTMKTNISHVKVAVKSSNKFKLLIPEIYFILTPPFVIWIIFEVQEASGRITLMTLNQCLAACAVKQQVTTGAWIITKLKAICLLLIEGLKERLEDIFKTEPPWPIVLGATFARTAGIVLTVVLIIIIVISYCLFCREGKHAGYLNSSNKKARKMQMSLNLLLLLIIAIGRHPDNTIFRLSACLVLLFALCFSPVVYGQQNTELQTKLFNRKKPWILLHKVFL